MQFRIGIVEDHTEFRLGLVFMFTGMSEYMVAWHFGSVGEALAEGSDVDVILLDINLPAISGIEAIPMFNKQFPDARIIMLTVLEDANHIVQAITAGADGYILKKTHPHKIPEAIQQVMEGGAVLTPIVARQIFSLFKAESVHPVPENELTTREQEILTLLIEGQINEKIGEKLFISPQTVRSHVKNIYAKLQVHNRAEVVAKALREQLVRK
jgi:DNA-binding NarL/FixJ family response regulator